MKLLSPARRRALRAQAHHLDPVVSIGNQGLTPAVLHEIDVNLLAHELVKLKVHSDDRQEREALLERVCNALDAAPVQHLGKVLIVYRERPEDEERAPAARKPPKPTARTSARETAGERPRHAQPHEPMAARKTPRPRRRLG